MLLLFSSSGCYNDESIVCIRRYQIRFGAFCTNCARKYSSGATCRASCHDSICRIPPSKIVVFPLPFAVIFFRIWFVAMFLLTMEMRNWSSLFISWTYLGSCTKIWRPFLTRGYPSSTSFEWWGNSWLYISTVIEFRYFDVSTLKPCFRFGLLLSLPPPVPTSLTFSFLLCSPERRTCSFDNACLCSVQYHFCMCRICWMLVLDVSLFFHLQELFMPFKYPSRCSPLLLVFWKISWWWKISFGIGDDCES